MVVGRERDRGADRSACEGGPPQRALLDDLFVDDDVSPVRIDKAFSWEYPLSVHGLMHNVITNAWLGDPYPLDTLMIFMSNMAWNSTINPPEARRILNDQLDNAAYQIRCLVV